MIKVVLCFFATVMICLAGTACADGPLFLGDVGSFTNSDVDDLVLGDLDNDGDDDLILALENDRLGIALTHTNGTLTRVFEYEVGNYLGPVETVDINADGYLDVVVVSEYDYNDYLRTFINDGTGGFTAGGDYEVYNSSGGLATFDADGDGDEDIVHTSTTAMGVFINNSDGTLQARVDYPCGPNWTYTPGVADFDGDGDMDVAAPNYGYDTLRVLFNDGTGAFDSLVSYATCNNPNHAIAAKINADEYYDVVTCSWGDGTAAIVFHFNNGDGTFADTVSIDLPTRCMYIEAADVDDDGDTDLIAAQWLEGDNALLVLRNNGDGTFASPEGYSSDYPHAMKCSDFDKDGDLDIALAGWGGMAVIKYNDGAGNFFGAPAYPIGGLSFTVATGNLDGDLDDDFVTADQDNGWVLKYINNGDSTFTLSTDTVTVGSSPRAMILADLDGINGPDLAVVNETVDSMTVRLNLGGGAFAPAAAYAVGDQPYHLLAEDLNADAVTDLVAVNYGGNSVSIFINNGDGTFAAASTHTVAGDPYEVTAGDIDGDGDIDLMTSSYGSSDPYAVTALTNDGGGVFTVEPYIEVSRYNYGILLFDFTGDGIADLFVGDDEASRFYTGNGDGTFTEFASDSVLWSGTSPVAGDFDKDGDLDLALSYDGYGLFGVMINNDGVFLDPIFYPIPHYCYTLDAADLDGDGDLELIAVSTDWSKPNSALVFWNRTEQLPVDVDDNTESRPNLFTLKQNYPNPFNPTTTIDYTVPAKTHVTITVYNILGQAVRTLVDEAKPAGSYTVIWDGRDTNRETVASGVYFYRIATDEFVATKKMVLLK